MFYYTLAIGFVSGFWSEDLIKIWTTRGEEHRERIHRLLNRADRLQKGIVGILAAFTYYAIFVFILPNYEPFSKRIPLLLTLISTIYPEINDFRNGR